MEGWGLWQVGGSHVQMPGDQGAQLLGCQPFSHGGSSLNWLQSKNLDQLPLTSLAEALLGFSAGKLHPDTSKELQRSCVCLRGHG